MARKLPGEPARIVILLGAALAFVLLIGAGAVAGSYALTLHQIAVNHANHEATQQRQDAQAREQSRAQKAQACRQFAVLVESIISANADTKHAVTTSKSFGQLLTVALTRYYGTTGCPALRR